MRHGALEVTTYRGKPVAAYLYLSSASGAKSARTEDAGNGLRVDYDEHGAPLGIEITAPSAVTMAEMNLVLDRIGAGSVSPEDWAVLAAA
ncbi:DUF2283 domain-containing protein [Polyangium aurulentum]|uniref:DUF2283 domain-containing protein n=1 Tax=Polyangium aurulentum TaxID=2567896 RepID=UPI00146AD1A7|nr:DUF2283 domain-containing protein [Polyangium aurulentum]UQA60937.1 DUF2283 domain-containing protein [Polyangium aurulentum]